jgi:hypothetical protein
MVTVTSSWIHSGDDFTELSNGLNLGCEKEESSNIARIADCTSEGWRGETLAGAHVRRAHGSTQGRRC